MEGKKLKSIDRWTFFPWFSPLFEPLLYWLFLSQKTTETHPYCSCHLLKGKMSPAVALSPHNNALMCPLGFQRMPRKELRRLKASFTTFLFHVDVMWHESRTNTRSCLLYLSWCLQLVTVADKSREKNAKERHTHVLLWPSLLLFQLFPKVFGRGQMIFIVFENDKKVAFNIASEASYVYILSG